MKKIMLVGRSGAGKTSFCQAINDWAIEYKKTQAIEIVNNAIDTPGEYVENRALYKALIVSSVDADLIVLLQECTSDQSIFAPAFASMFGKTTIGLVTKTDLAENEKQINSARELLEMAGCEKIFEISSTKGTGIEEVKKYLEMG